MEVHVVSKVNNEQHAAFTLETPSSTGVELAPSSIRVRTFLISLTSNNLSYARGGDVLHWWDTYPVPTNSPPPYNDNQQWGIVPAWGYAVVVETTSSIPQDTVLWGFWPTASVPTDLKIKATEPKRHWIEISDHRQKLMNIYNRYFEVPKADVSPSSLSFDDNELERMAWNTLFSPVWQTGYLLSQYVFPQTLQTQSPIHPLGIDAKWTPADADLSSAVVVSLSASGKTARCFAYHLSRRPTTTGPLGLLQVTSSPSPISKAAENLQSSFPMKSIAYSEISESSKWIASLEPSKIVILDFGARGATLALLLESIRSSAEVQSSKVIIIQIGSQQKVYTNEEVLEAREAMSKLGKLQFNSSGVRDAAMKLKGTEAYFDTVSPLWDEWLRDRHRNIPDMKLVWGKGTSGSDGIEGGWKRLCQGQVGAEYGLVYQL